MTGSAIVDDGSREVAQVLGIDWGGDGAVRDVRLVGPPGRPHPVRRGSRRCSRRGSVFVSVPVRRAAPPGAGRRRCPSSRAACAARVAVGRDPGALGPGAGLGRRHPRHRHLHGPGPARKEGPRRPRGHRARSGRLAGRRRAEISRAAARRASSLEPPGPRRADGRSDGPRLPLQPERARLAHAARRDLPDRQRRLDRGAAPPARDRDAARARRLAVGDLRRVSRRGPRDRRRRHAARRGPRALRVAGGAVGGRRDGVEHLPADGAHRGRGLRRRRVARGRRRHLGVARRHAAAGDRGDAGRAVARDAAGIDRGRGATAPGAARAGRARRRFSARPPSPGREPVDGFPLFGFARRRPRRARPRARGAARWSGSARRCPGACSPQPSAPRAASPRGSSAARSRAMASR